MQWFHSKLNHAIQVNQLHWYNYDLVMPELNELSVVVVVVESFGRYNYHEIME